MSEIKKLIERLCPEGVEYKKLGEIAKRLRGTSITATTMKKIASEEGEIKVFAGGKTVINAHLKDIPNANIITVPSVLCQSRGVIDFVYYDKPFTFKNEMWAYTLDNTISVKYIYYVLKHNVMYFRDKATAMGAFPQISIPDTEKFEIPVPPIEVQSKIVEILDNFTELEAELEDELEAELEARRKQYEYYRDQFFSSEKVSQDMCKPMSEVGTLIRGKRFVRTDIVESGVPCIHYGDMYTYYGLKADKAKTYLTPEKATKMRFAKKNDVVIVGAGENKMDIGIGVAWLGEEDAAVHDACYIFKSDLNPQYVSHFLRTSGYHKQIFPFVSEGKICSISAKSLGRAIIPIPPLAEQERIVSILDRFEALTTDLQSGLPAEIAARRKQYEYYREKLLTFKRKTA